MPLLLRLVVVIEKKRRTGESLMKWKLEREEGGVA